MRKLHTFIVVLLAIGGSACGSGRSNSTEGGPRPADADLTLAEATDTRVAVEVRNNLIPATTVTAYYTAAGDRPTLLGTVRSNATETFVIETRMIAGGFVLIAERQGLDAMRSRRITDVARAKITWNLGTNIINIERIGG